MTAPLLQVKNLTVTFTTGDRQKIPAVSDISFAIARGETLGLVGESGCGKSSLARAVMRLSRSESGAILFEGRDLVRMDKKKLRELRPRFQMVFQDSVSSLNPRRRILDTLTAAVPGKTSPDAKKRLARQMLARVGIDPAGGHLRPFQFSGGQCQRIQIARALMTDPALLVCDEPVSSLDVSIQAQILNLLEALRIERGLTMLFISHDLAVVKHVCDRVMVMYLGRLCESAPCASLYAAPCHPYTRALLSAVPVPDPIVPPGQIHLKTGELPSPGDPPSGCRFRTRCPESQDRCAREEPLFREITPGHWAACHFPRG